MSAIRVLTNTYSLILRLCLYTCYYLPMSALILIPQKKLIPLNTCTSTNTKIKKNTNTSGTYKYKYISD